MTDKKEKSAVGTAIPATEKDMNNSPENIISGNEEKIKGIFKPDSYTMEAMPISSALFSAINDMGNLDHNSVAVNACIKKYKAVNDQFYSTLTEEQIKLFNDTQWGDLEELGIVSNEYFNRGLRFGVLLIKEIMGV